MEKALTISPFELSPKVQPGLFERGKMCVSKKENMFEDPKVVTFFQFFGVDIDVDVDIGVDFVVSGS